MLVILATALLAGCAGGRALVLIGSNPLPAGLSRDQLLSDIAACHLLRVGQTGDNSVTDAAVLAATQRYGYSVNKVVQRANQLVRDYQSNGPALGARAQQACGSLAELTQVPSALVRFERGGAPRAVWLRVNGDIDDGFAQRVISALRKNRAVGLVINSPGGAVAEARKLGRYLRANGLRTAVDGVCVSACIDVLAGGSERYATPGAKLGTHQSKVPGRYSSHAGGQYYVADSYRYLREMGVDAEVAIAAALIPNDKILLIPVSDALKTRLITVVVERL
ncbi:ATP-dependent Clp protease proteolytic subunit [uncultured Lamprocystis sp.]|uniref:ATP-dependent Clp protease proteolytic subunit n=1 Tax=uncultured Lamprocystis sp. TaxID=543132 RepID=UPI0025DA4D7E|nr:ATP-dependent Clp protease proteolytic subunit [uncultured Lamprocystis sp.]